MTRKECLDFFSRLPSDGFLALDEKGVVVGVQLPSCFEDEKEINVWLGQDITSFAQLQNPFQDLVPDWKKVLEKGLPAGTNLVVGKHRIALKPGPTVFDHPDGDATLFLIFDRSYERYYQLLHRLKGHFHLLLGYFHLRECNTSADVCESLAFLDARAITTIVSALGDAYRQSNGETLHIFPSTVLLPLLESFSGRWQIVGSRSFSPETPMPVRFVEKIAFWIHQILVLALRQRPQSPARMEWLNVEQGIYVAFCCEDVDWHRVVDDASASGELARAYLSDLSGQVRITGEKLAADFPSPAPFLAKI